MNKYYEVGIREKKYGDDHTSYMGLDYDKAIEALEEEAHNYVYYTKEEKANCEIVGKVYDLPDSIDISDEDEIFDYLYNQCDGYNDLLLNRKLSVEFYYDNCMVSCDDYTIFIDCSKNVSELYDSPEEWIKDFKNNIVNGFINKGAIVREEDIVNLDEIVGAFESKINSVFNTSFYYQEIDNEKAKDLLVRNGFDDFVNKNGKYISKVDASEKTNLEKLLNNSKKIILN